jgi:hypothetical protein
MVQGPIRLELELDQERQVRNALYEPILVAVLICCNPSRRQRCLPRLNKSLARPAH